MSSPHYLSKSRLISGWQCPRRLWLETYEPERAQISAQTQALFDAGHEAGAAARTLWPDGILIEHDSELSKALEETQAILQSADPVTIFEATFRHEGILIRGDVLERNDAGEIRLVEVKASTSVKDYHTLDCAIQHWVLDQAGLTPESVWLAHINGEFIYQGDGNYQGLFRFENVTASSQKMQSIVPQLANELREILAEMEPAIEVGSQCKKPFECPFIEHCSPPATRYPVEKLSGSRKVIAELKAEGIEDICDIPAGRLTNSRQERVRRVTAAGQPELEPGARAVLQGLPYPRYYLDFETTSFAVPVWKDTGPHRAYPFQWSVHIEQDDGSLEHREYLADSAEPPMRECMEQLVAVLGDAGPIMAYTNYEKTIITRMAARFPDLHGPLQAIVDRLFDLHPVTRANYYHPDMCGSWSLKKILPTVAPELDYQSVGEITEGGAADNAFQQLIRGDLSPDRRTELRQALLDYCKLDTLAMVRLAHFLAVEE